MSSFITCQCRFFHEYAGAKRRLNRKRKIGSHLAGGKATEKQSMKTWKATSGKSRSGCPFYYYTFRFQLHLRIELGSITSISDYEKVCSSSVLSIVSPVLHSRLELAELLKGDALFYALSTSRENTLQIVINLSHSLPYSPPHTSYHNIPNSCRWLPAPSTGCSSSTIQLFPLFPVQKYSWGSSQVHR